MFYSFLVTWIGMLLAMTLLKKILEVDESVNPNTYDNAEDPRVPRPRGVRKSRRRRRSSRRHRG